MEIDPANLQYVPMDDIAVTRDDTILEAVPDSCIAIGVANRMKMIGYLAHVPVDNMHLTQELFDMVERDLQGTRGPLWIGVAGAGGPGVEAAELRAATGGSHSTDDEAAIMDDFRLRIDALVEARADILYDRTGFTPVYHKVLKPPRGWLAHLYTSVSEIKIGLDPYNPAQYPGYDQ